MMKSRQNTSSARSPRRTCVEGLETRQLLAAVPSSLGGSDRATVDFNSNWKFIEQDVAGAQATDASTSGWSTVSLPHTFNATDGADGGTDNSTNTFDYYRGGTWYRNSFSRSKAWSTRRVFIQVDAAAIKADVYVNGTFVGSHVGDYSAFTFDITNALGGAGSTNVVAIRVDNTQDTNVPGYQGDFTKWGGLTRGVDLYASNRLHVNSTQMGASGVKVVQADVSSASATLGYTINLRNDNSQTKGYVLKSSLVDAKGKVVATTSKSLKLKRKQSKTFYQTLNITNPHLWNGVADPYLYTSYTQVISGSDVIDTLSQRVGIRSITTDSTGLKLNGVHVTLKGVNLHDDKAGVGTAMTDADRSRDVDLLTQMGANAVRFAHWQVDQNWYDLADQKGLLVWTEIPLWGNHITATQAFTDNSVNELRELIRQSAQHPSIAYWGLFNEIPNNSTTQSLIATLQDVAKSEDPSRTTIAASDLSQPAAINLVPDTVMLNKYYGWYTYAGGETSLTTDQRLAQFGTWLSQNASNTPSGDPLGIGEYGAGANINQHTNDPTTAAPTGNPNTTQFQPEEYQAYLHEKTYEQIKASSAATWGSFIWEFADSANDDRDEGSEPGINTKGLITYDRSTQKDAYFYYKSQWSSSPTLYLTSKRFTNRTDASTYVKAYSNLGSNVTLTINGHGLGTRNDGSGVLEWDNVTLDDGANVVVITGTKNGKTYTDTATWTLDTARGAGLSPQSFAAASLSPPGLTSATKNFFADATPILA